VEGAVAVGSVGRRDLTGDQLLERGDGDIDVA
jgi:hypothetical protein